MNARILVIEDNAANLELMRYLLTAFKYEVLTAERGGEGVETAMRERPNLILCDVQLPDIDGVEVLRRLRNSASLPRIPVIAVTALAMVGDRDRLLAEGFDGYISKPIDPATFVQAVEDFLPEIAQRLSDPAPKAETKPVVAGPLPLRTLLAVDNLQANLDFARSLFEHFGFRVVTTTDPGQAVSLALEHRPDLIMSDVCMPDDSGYDLIKRIKAEPSLNAIPFVFITSTQTNERARKTGLGLGAAKFLFRPIEPEQLLAEIQALIPERKG